MTFCLWTSDQVRMSWISIDGLRSYAPFWTKNTWNAVLSYPHFSTTCCDTLSSIFVYDFLWTSDQFKVASPGIKLNGYVPFGWRVYDVPFAVIWLYNILGKGPSAFFKVE